MSQELDNPNKNQLFDKYNRKRIKARFFRQGRWTKEEHESFINALIKIGKNNWRLVY